MLIRHVTSIVLPVLFLLIPACAMADEKPAASEPTAKQEKAFSKQLSNTTLTGRFTFDDKMNALPKEERYEIKKVSKLSGNLWVFMVRIKYGTTDVTLPVTVPVVWADGTPMVSLKNATIPGMGGGFSAHVVFEGGRYAGTWQHNSKGGHLFGMIAKTSELAKKKEAPKSEESKKK